MDITELLPLIIFGLIYLFGSAAKKKAEQAKKQPAAQVPQRSAEPQKKQSLQARLEEALREMQSQVNPEPSTTARTKVNVEPEQTKVERVYDSDLYSSETTEQQNFAFHSLMEEVPQETYHGHGFTGFSEGHGLHARGETKTTFDDANKVSTDFHTAHGLHYKESLIPGKQGTTPHTAEQPPSPVFADVEALRRAFILSEILDKPKALR
ncbi:MAG: hypothetical protein KDD67_13265 [Ignavibacteriae bacterium]|nr:hypothetical protein [Ignavibacteriota bacterium]MCB9214447.1 hypothetical protein [Ignavibacteria bacterium]